MTFKWTAGFAGVLLLGLMSVLPHGSARAAAPSRPLVEIPLSEAERIWLKEHPVLRVSSEPDYIPFDFRENGEPVGYSIDYVNLLTERLGIRVEYVKDSWGKLLQKAEAKEVDLVHSIFNFPAERERYLNFTQPYKEVLNAIIVPKDQEGIDSLEALEGRTVAIVEGDSLGGLIARRPNIDVQLFHDYRSALKAVALGKVDAAVSELPVAVYLIRKLSLTNLKTVAQAADIRERDQRYRLAVRKDWPILISILEKAMESLTPAELRRLDDKWIAGFRHLGLMSALNEAEYAWLKAHPEIRLGVDPDWPPFEFMELGHEYRGIAADFIHIIGQRLGIEMNPAAGLSWTEVLEKAKAGEIDVLPCVVKTPEREKYLHFTDSYLTKPLAIISRNNAAFMGGISDIRGTVAVVRGYFFDEVLLRDYPYKQYYKVDTISEAIQAVAEGDAEAFIGNLPSISQTIQREGYKNLMVSGFTEYTFELHMAVRKDWPELVSILNKELGAIPSSEKSQIVSSWMNVRIEKETNWMPMIYWMLGITAFFGILISYYVNTNRKLAAEVNERRLLEEALRHSRDAAEAANQAKSRFLANMSHEIRTPMNAVLGYTEILRMREREPKKLRYIESIRSSGNVLLDLINDVLDLSKIESGKVELQYTAVSIADLFREMEVVFEQKAHEQGDEIEAAVAPGFPPALLLDEVRLRQILINLVGNAVKFTQDGVIRLEAMHHAGGPPGGGVHLTLRISDSGIGIPENQQGIIFEPFDQVKGQKVLQYGGTGLGLTICRRYVELMQGTIRVESAAGEGSTFIIDFPEVALASEVDRPEGPEESIANIRFDPATLLIADDLDFNREILQVFLEDYGFTILEAVNGEEVLELSRKHHPDLILLDLKMPKMDGREAARRLKADDALKNIPVIAVTASGLRMDQEAMASQCDGFLYKPVDKAVLVRELMQFCPYTDESAGTDACGCEAESGFPEIPGLDTESGLRYTGGRDVYISVLSTFVEQYEETKRVLCEGGPTDIQNKVHALKSLAGMIGTAALREQAALLEETCSRRPPDADELKHFLGLYAALVQSVRAHFPHDGI